MTSFPTSAQCSTSDSACRISPKQVNQVRPKLPLLKILQAAGAQGEMFTVKEVLHYLGKYIMAKQLYDQQEQHMVYCGGDLLGELLGRQSFSVREPSPLYDMLRKNLVTLATTTTGTSHHISLFCVTALSSRGQMMGKQSRTKMGMEGHQGATGRDGLCSWLLLCYLTFQLILKID
ncbi:protein Mdm4-like isoform X3 [Talpa occidentalis]|uniref:protein Mdm4-like isoform X3 n=1 Tax=Talpa occidentalis TaxID=50954 RepID=UPI00188FD860|nr:protein Mdm4-like isoform X3 [Talpa occidentalis]XP_037374257.1 protein Mdm4-like isoform X3 [Talpa occidentalis]XP_037374259.1 protein Mdm4-like isoform X3 [Talpa occidentalis]XP_054553673.1 protein Mdm4-like isoform X3 [Talpa occidentalis]